ncbi:MAG: serine/threonine protein kinase, partial [Streptomyces sp.]|nr:serine/threonine protein kinase [Streptomyces sp.]
VGLVALYLLEGAKPDAKALIQYFAAHGTPSAPKGVPEPLWQVVATLLQPDPQARFRTATGARKALASARELLPEPGPDDELIEIFDQLGPLPPGFAPSGPLKAAPGVEAKREADTDGTGASEAFSRPVERHVEEEASSVSSASDAGGVASTGVTPLPDPRRGSAHQPEPSVPTQPPSMSDTGSFHLPPPQATASFARTPAPQPPTPPAPARPDQGSGHQTAYASPDDPTHVLPSPRSYTPLHSARAQAPTPYQRADVSTVSYTAQAPQVPPPVQAIRQETTRRSHRARPARRPGPPAKVAIPLLLLALSCYAVGFWALTRI